LLFSLRRSVIFLFCLVGVFLFCSHGVAAIYSCKDAGGVVHFTNAPSASNCEPYVKKKKSLDGIVKQSQKRLSSHLYENHIQSASTRYRVDPNLIKAVIQVESDFDRLAVSPKGAQGLMQLMPETARELHVDNPFNARENIHGGTKYLRKLLTMFKGDLTLTLAAYNAGPTLVRKVNRTPRIPETVQYVNKVLYHYKKYRGGILPSPTSTIKVGGLELASSR